MLDFLKELMGIHPSRPLSIAVVVVALFVPASLTIFLSRPQFFTTLGLNGVILLSIGISLPIVLLCFGIFRTPLSAVLKAQRLTKGKSNDFGLDEALNTEDRLEWPSLFAGGWTANFFLYLVVVIAYVRPLRIGSTFLLVAAVLFVVWIFVWIASVLFYRRVEREVEKTRV
jgi:hypothetical protein